MSLNLVDALTQLPSVARFRERVLDDLKQGRSALVVLNRSEYTEALWLACHTALWRENFDIVEVDAAQTGTEESPVQVLSSQLEITWPAAGSAHSLDALLSCDLPEIIAVRGLDILTHQARQTWLTLFARWASTVQSRVTGGQRLSCLWGMINLQREDEIPSSEVWLRIHWWWAMPSALEIRVLCRSEDGVGNAVLPPVSAWREALMPELASNDLLLIDALWDVLQEDRQLVFDRLLSFASERGWTKQQLEAWEVPDFLRRQGSGSRRFAQEPSREERELWMRDILTQIPERGLQVSSAALAVLEAWDRLEHRLWRGQAALLLPMIDELRLSICERLTRKFGSNWPWQWWEPTSQEEKIAVRENPLSTQLGHLENLIRNCKDLADERRYLSAIGTARYIRNQLAHYSPVTFTAYANLLSFLS